MSLPSSTNKLTELEIVIPRDKFNDMGFIFRKLMETSLDVLDTIAKNSDKKLADLAKEFLPDLKNLSQPDIFLAKWGLTMSMLNSNSSATSNVSDNTKETPSVEDDVVSTTSSVSSKKKRIKINKKKNLKVTKKTPVTSDEKPVEETVVSEKQDTKEVKPLVKKLNKIKLSKPTSSSASVSSDSATSTASSDKPKKKLKLRRPKKMKINSSD